MRIGLRPCQQIGGRQPANAMDIRIRQLGRWPGVGRDRAARSGDAGGPTINNDAGTVVVILDDHMLAIRSQVRSEAIHRVHVIADVRGIRTAFAMNPNCNVAHRNAWPPEMNLQVRLKTRRRISDR